MGFRQVTENEPLQNSKIYTGIEQYNNTRESGRASPVIARLSSLNLPPYLRKFLPTLETHARHLNGNTVARMIAGLVLTLVGISAAANFFGAFIAAVGMIVFYDAIRFPSSE